MKRFSLLVPTREREQLANKFMNSIWTNTTHKHNIEILFLCDNDDGGSQNYVIYLQKKFSAIDIKLINRDRTEFINKDYYNYLADRAEGEYLWVLADDLEIVRPNWDEIVYNNIQNFLADKPDKIVCVSIKDNTPPPSHRLPKFPCFPMFSRQAKDFFGWILHPAPPNWGADYIVYMIYRPANRLLEINDTNYINHISYHTKQVQPDNTNRRIGEIFNRLKMIPKYNTDRILSEEVPKLRQQLENKLLVEKDRWITQLDGEGKKI